MARLLAAAPGLMPEMLPFDDFVSFSGLPEMRGLELRFEEE